MFPFSFSACVSWFCLVWIPLPDPNIIRLFQSVLLKVAEGSWPCRAQSLRVMWLVVMVQSPSLGPHSLLWGTRGRAHSQPSVSLCVCLRNLMRTPLRYRLLVVSSVWGKQNCVAKLDQSAPSSPLEGQSERWAESQHTPHSGHFHLLFCLLGFSP